MIDLIDDGMFTFVHGDPYRSHPAINSPELQNGALLQSQVENGCPWISANAGSDLLGADLDDVVGRIFGVAMDGDEFVHHNPEFPGATFFFKAEPPDPVVIARRMWDGDQNLVARLNRGGLLLCLLRRFLDQLSRS